jgi:signal transduction histidine kinase
MSRNDLRSPPRLTPFAVSYTVIVLTLLSILYLGVTTATGARGFVGGESAWSKAQKQAAACLQRYAIERSDREMACYRSQTQVMLSARRAREELLKHDPDMDTARKYLIAAKAHPKDVNAMAVVFSALSNHRLMRPVVDAWTQGDAEVEHMNDIAAAMQRQVAIGNRHTSTEFLALLDDLRATDERLTTLEYRFSASLGDAARYVRSVLYILTPIIGALLLGIALLFASRSVRTWQQAQRLAGDRAARMRAVAGAAAGVGAATTLPELDTVIRHAIAKVVDHDRCTFAIYDADTHTFEFVQSPGNADGVIQRIPARETSGEEFLRDRTSILTVDASDERSADPFHAGNGQRSESVVRCAMYSGPRLLGLIAVHSFEPDHYSEDDVEVLETLSSVAASAVERIESMHEREIAEEGLRRSEEQLIQAQKMEAVGLLAGGIAHDFNNLLTAIKGNSELLRQDECLPDELRDHVCEITAAADRAAALTGQLLAFSRRQVLQPRVVDINALVENMNTLVRRLIGEDVVLVTNLETDLWHVRADPHQMEQVLLNVTLNARDAMPQGGSLLISTSNIPIDAESADTPGLAPGAYVRIAVQDSGIGMSEESLGRIFEPFYTTKAVGKGTGLGLSTVYGIVKQSGGHIYVQSAPDDGTTMQIYLPRTTDPLDPPLAPSTDRVDPADQSGVVLVVEDEATVRTLLSRVLARKGYDVMEAATGEEALAILNSDLHVDLLLTDTVMPGISGVELAERARIIRPSLAVLHMSGYTEDEVFRRGLSRRGEDFLQKPFSPAVLLSNVADALSKVRV